MNRVPRTALGGGALLACLVLTACSTGSDTPSGANSDSFDPMAQGPLGEYATQVFGNFSDSTSMDNQTVEAENLTASCMSEAGFDYLPNTGNVRIPSEDEQREMFTLEWIEQNGYGFFSMNDPASDEDAPSDPNADAVAEMSDSERTAFYEALYGPEATEEDIDGGDTAPSGCMTESYSKVFGAEAVGGTTEDEFSDIRTAVQQFYLDFYGYENPTTNPDLQELNSEWSQCMSDEGHDFDSPTDAQNAASTMVNDYYTEYANEDGTFKDGSDDAFAEGKANEVSIAVTDYTCSEKTGYQAKAQQIQFAAEQAFVDEHKSELDAWVAAVGVEPSK